MNRLIGPLSYLRVTHPTKILIDFIFPLIAAVIVFLLRVFTSKTTGLLSEDGLLPLLIPLLGALSGFYIAALTAVSAFPINALDREMPGDRLRILGNTNNKNPTRRTFLSMMFGYLAFVSIILFLICLFSIYFKTPISHLRAIDALYVGDILSWVSLFVILFTLFNLIFVTFFSIYYLSDRIHQYEPALQGGPTPTEPKAHRL